MPHKVQTVYSRFREQMLSSVRAASSIVAYNARILHLEPLAEARFEKGNVEDWLSKVHATRPLNSARELVRLARRFWEFGLERGAWSGPNPFCKRQRPPPAERACGAYLTPLEIREVLEKAPDAETRAFWGCCALAGLRQSEAAGLKRQNLDFKDSRIGMINRIVGLPRRGNAPDFVELSEGLRLLLQDLSYTPPPPAKTV
jgi:integrase